MYDLLRAALPPLGQPYKESALDNMKETTKHELGVKPKLEIVAYCPTLFQTLLELATAKAQTMHTLWERPADFFFAAHATPGVAASLHPSTIYDEEDVRRYCRYTIINPALLGFHALTKNNLVIPTETVYPYVASGTHYEIIPDDTIIVEEGNKGVEGRPHIMGTIEYKAPHVHKIAAFHNIMIPPDADVGVRAMRFIWPTKPSQVSSTEHIQTRMIIQVRI